MEGVFFEVETSESLVDIIFKHYGSVEHLDEVMDANRALFVGSDIFLKPGTKVFLPQGLSSKVKKRKDIWEA